MHRRTFLAGAGLSGSLGTLHYTTRDPAEALEVRFWLSEQASAYRSIAETITAYLEWALAYDFWRVSVSYGGVVSVEDEQGAHPVQSGRWPTRLGAGVAGVGSAEPARDVNLLVTDGSMRRAPTGYAMPHVASVGGARHLEKLEPPDWGTNGERPYDRPNFSMQVLLHEVGHTLGLRHEHGMVYRSGARTVATPMVSAYAWDSDFHAEESLCGEPYERRFAGKRAISMRFSDCARSRLEDYSGGLIP